MVRLIRCSASWGDPVTDAPSSELVDEFRAAWAPREAELELNLQRASSFHAGEGRSRSGALLEDHARVFSDGIGTATAIILERTNALASRKKRLSASDLARLTESACAQVTELGSQFDERLRRSAENMGLSALAPNVREAVRAANATMKTDIKNAFQTAAARVSKPFAQSLIGGVSVAVVAGLILLAASKACK